MRSETRYTKAYINMKRQMIQLYKEFDGQNVTIQLPYVNV